MLRLAWRLGKVGWCLMLWGLVVGMLVVEFPLPWAVDVDWFACFQFRSWVEALNSG